jgi:hypothetical protein
VSFDTHMACQCANCKVWIPHDQILCSTCEEALFGQYANDRGTYLTQTTGENHEHEM